MQLRNVASVAAKLDGSVSTVWVTLREDPTFPRPIYIRPTMPRWIDDELDAWLLTRKQQTRENTHAESKD